MATKRLFHNMTLTQKLALYFQARGYRPVESRCKYRVVTSPSDTVHYLFLGKAGAIRHNTKIAANSSRDVSGYFMPHFIKWEDNQPDVMTLLAK
jgi:hypothetical protein